MYSEDIGKALWTQKVLCCCCCYSIGDGPVHKNADAHLTSTHCSKTMLTWGPHFICRTAGRWRWVCGLHVSSLVCLLICRASVGRRGWEEGAKKACTWDLSGHDPSLAPFGLCPVWAVHLGESATFYRNTKVLVPQQTRQSLIPEIFLIKRKIQRSEMQNRTS